jgi:glycosyltransferase involved in cell wall biosynthesis
MDVDDAIWLSRPFGFFAAADIARSMDAVIAGNNYLLEYFGRYCRKVYIVPTAVDLDRYEFQADSENERPKKFVIGWTGLAYNYRYLKLIEKPLRRFLQDHPDAELKLVAQRPWESREIAPEKIRFVTWSRESEAKVLQEMSVGIMPLSDDKWTRGKCSFKMLQYMAVGLPVIVSPVGMNRDVLQKADLGFAASSNDEWYDALKTLYEDRSLGVRLGLAGRKVVEQFYSADLIATELANIFKSILGR